MMGLRIRRGKEEMCALRLSYGESTLRLDDEKVA